jgi:hypothetical protein
METGFFWDLGRISDTQLRSGLGSLLASGYRTEARIIAHIAEVEARKLHAKDGSPSLFDYCVRQLGLSESEAFHRLTAARIARRFPIVFSLIERRQIHLTAVCLLRDYLTPDNHLELLAEASNKTKLQVQELLARRFPRPDVASYVRKLPSRAVCDASKHATRFEIADSLRDTRRGDGVEGRAAGEHSPPSRGAFNASEHPKGYKASEHSAQPPAPAPTTSSAPTAGPTSLSSTSSPSTGNSAPPRASIPAQTAPARALIEPRSEARYRIQLNASSSLKEKLELFQALVSHSIPNGDIAAVLERALELALEQVEKQRFAKTDKPRDSKRTPKPRGLRLRSPGSHRENIPNAVQREVATRDGLRCSYVSDAGCRCSARAFLQIHHEQPWARSGASVPENLRLLCALHNRLLAERDFGSAHIAERLAARRAGNARAANAEALPRNVRREVLHRRDGASSSRVMPDDRLKFRRSI